MKDVYRNSLGFYLVMLISPLVIYILWNGNHGLAKNCVPLVAVAIAAFGITIIYSGLRTFVYPYWGYDKKGFQTYSLFSTTVDKSCL